MKRSNLRALIALLLTLATLLTVSGCDTLAGTAVPSGSDTGSDTVVESTEPLSPHDGHKVGGSVSVDAEINGEAETFNAQHIEMCDGLVLMDYFTDDFELFESLGMVVWKERRDDYLVTTLEFEYAEGDCVANYSDVKEYFEASFGHVEEKHATIGGIDCVGYLRADHPDKEWWRDGFTSITYYIDMPDGLLLLSVNYMDYDEEAALPQMMAMLETVEFTCFDF